MLHQLRVCGGAQGFAHRDALGAVVAQNAHFNQFVRRQGGIGFFDNRFGQDLLAGLLLMSVCLSEKSGILRESIGSVIRRPSEIV